MSRAGSAACRWETHTRDGPGPRVFEKNAWKRTTGLGTGDTIPWRKRGFGRTLCRAGFILFKKGRGAVRWTWPAFFGESVGEGPLRHSLLTHRASPVSPDSCASRFTLFLLVANLAVFGLIWINARERNREGPAAELVFLVNADGIRLVAADSPDLSTTT